MSSEPPVNPIPALFLEPPSRDFGVRWFGQRAFGGILQNDDNQWIPQYNLQNYWRRRIPPILVGLAEPLIPPRIRRTHDCGRLPGHFHHNTKEYELYNRNLLAARFFPGTNEEINTSGVLKVWTVNERSKRNYLEGFDIEINKNGQPQTDEIMPVFARKLKMVPPIKSEDVPRRHKEPILEIRTSTWSGQVSTNLFLRSPTLLQMMEVTDDRSQRQLPIFHTAVKSFAESPLQQGKLVVVDYGGRSWLLQLEEPMFKARKLGNPEELYQNVVFTDHPMKLALAGHFHVELVDSRGSYEVLRLWKTPEFATRGHSEPLYFQDTPPTPPVIRHVANVPTSANNYVVMTDFSMVLLDDRFPGTPVLEIKHPFSTAGQRFLVPRKPILDSGGEIFPIFSLEQLPILTSSVSMTKLYRHCSGLWSVVDSFHSFGEPYSFNETVRRGMYAEGSQILKEPTRAVCLVEMEENSVLLRQTDDGAIWWQNIINTEISEEEKMDEEIKSSERVEETLLNKEEWRRDGWDPVYSNTISEEVKENQLVKRSLIHIEISDIDQKTISKCAQRAHTVQRKITFLRGEEDKTWKKLEVLKVKNDNSLLSKITLDTWRDSEAKMEATRNNS